MGRIKSALTVAALAVSVAAGAAWPSTARDGGALACFGAAAHDPNHPCHNPALRTDVIPSPAVAREGRNAPCESIRDEGPLRICEFGAAARNARATIALLGDSHAAHWRAALEYVADTQDWHGVSLTLSGCPYSTATRVLRTGLRDRCIARNRDVPSWLERHPDIHVVFVSELSGASWRLGPYSGSAFDAEANAYVRAWDQLPPSVREIVVIRDTPKATSSTDRCIERAHSRREDAGIACSVPRRVALDPDAAAQAATEVGGPRLQTIDMTRYFCNATSCPPVIGGALVQKDLHHLSVVFVRTLGPYLLEAVRQLAPPVY